MANVTFERAYVLCYRIFDIANEIDLPKVEQLLSLDTRRLKLSRANSQYLQLPNPPVTVQLGKHALKMQTGLQEVDVAGRIFDHGAASIIVKVPLSKGAALESVVALADELYDSTALDELCVDGIRRLRADIVQACEEPHLWDQSESYTVIYAQELGGQSLQQFVDSPEVARLLLGERDGAPLSERERAAVTSTQFSYKQDDVAIIDWNSAFVFEPSGSTDIPDLLEICNAQLLEFRYYDELLDEFLASIYDELQKNRNKSRVWRSPYKAMIRRVLATLLEMSEFIERVDNSLKIIGDFYLAKVYEGAVRRMRIPVWQASVTRKQHLLTQTYQLLKGEVDTARSLTLEASIVALIVVELVLAFLPLGH